MSLSVDWWLEQARLGNMYTACSAGTVTSSTVSVTSTGLALSNAFGSRKLLVVYKGNFAPSNAPGGVSILGWSIHTAVSETAVVHSTPMVIHNAMARGNVSGGPAGRCDASATLPSTPLWLRPIGGVAAASSVTPARLVDDVDGSIIIVPGGCLSTSYLTTAWLGIMSVTWVEVDE
jgi:hypothetical protein